MDCHEEGCPGPLAFVPKSYGSLRPDLKMMETMGRRIEALERLVCEVADYLRSIGVTEPKLETSQGRLLAESLLIQKKQTNKKEGADHGC